uniref:Uncharacterized protein n=1 Tax=Acrobeloides nanus TaxID=290746 RepID=A0A914EPB0_9BILA
MVVPGDMKLVKIVDKRDQLIVDKRTQDRMQIVKMCCTHRCTASSVRQHVCAKPEEMKQLLEFLGPQRNVVDRRRSLPF